MESDETRTIVAMTRAETAAVLRTLAEWNGGKPRLELVKGGKP